MKWWKIWNWKQGSKDETINELEEIIKEARSRQIRFAVIFTISVVVICLTIRFLELPRDSPISCVLRYVFSSFPFCFVLYQRKLVSTRLKKFTGVQASDLINAVAQAQGFINTAVVMGIWPFIAHADSKEILEGATNWFFITQ